MTLIIFSDCGSDVSSNASFCQKCGNPIGQSNQVKSVGAPVYTTEATSKKLKLHYL